MSSLFHATSARAALAIDSVGFVDGDFAGVAHGVFFSDRPLDAADGVAASTEVVFVLDVPPGFPLDDFELIEEGRPPNAYREWLIPAATANAWPLARHVDDGAIRRP